MGSKTCCEILLKAGADVNAIGGEFGTAIQAAVYAKRIKIVRLLLDAGADVISESTISGFYGTALQAAAAADSIRIVRELLHRGATPNTSKANGEFGCALQVAATVSKPGIAKLLLEHGANANFTGGFHHLPIMAAAQFPRPLNLKLLLDYGADATATGGIWGSAIIAAAYGNNLECIKTLVSRGADIRATGGLYGSALQAAAIKADIKIIEYILDRAINLVNHRDGKYYTPLIAAAYLDRLDVVTKLLDNGADFRHRGGRYRSVITAAAIRGNKAILEKFLEMGPDESLLDEALVEAVAHRQSASVDLLLRSRANVFTRHPTLGSPAEALEAPEVTDVNSDDEEDSDKEEDGSDDGADDEDEEGEVQWEGDDGASISGETDTGSVVDLQLEEEVTETAKIQKLLAEAEARRKRNPTIERFKSVKVRGTSVRSRGHVPPPPVPQLPSTANFAQFQLPEQHVTRHRKHSQTSRNAPSRSGSGHERPVTTVAQPGYPLSSHVSQTALPAQVLARKPVQSPSDSSQHGASPQNSQQEQYPFPASQADRQYSTGSVSKLTRSYTPPSRKGSEDQGLKRNSKVVNRRSVANLGLASKYQHRQSSHSSPQGSMDQLIELDGSGETTASPAPTLPPDIQSAYPQPKPQPPALPTRQLPQVDQPQQWQQFDHPPQVHNFNQPLHGQYQGNPPAPFPRYAWPPPQAPGHAPYNLPSQNLPSQTSSPASFQSSLFANSTPRDGQIPAWETPPSVQGEFRAPDDIQRRKWGSGGYDGDGYGG
jgi:ankyrin repeat protein